MADVRGSHGGGGHPTAQEAPRGGVPHVNGRPSEPAHVTHVEKTVETTHVLHEEHREEHQDEFLRRPHFFRRSEIFLGFPVPEDIYDQPIGVMPTSPAPQAPYAPAPQPDAPAQQDAPAPTPGRGATPATPAPAPATPPAAPSVDDTCHVEKAPIVHGVKEHISSEQEKKMHAEGAAVLKELGYLKDANPDAATLKTATENFQKDYNKRCGPHQLIEDGIIGYDNNKQGFGTFNAMKQVLEEKKTGQKVEYKGAKELNLEVGDKEVNSLDAQIKDALKNVPAGVVSTAAAAPAGDACAVTPTAGCPAKPARPEYKGK